MMGYLRHYLDLRTGSVPEEEKLPTLERLERDYIAYLLAVTSRNVTEVSRILGVSRNTVYHKSDLSQAS
jgi:DNA-binding NtrC family response regulator